MQVQVLRAFSLAPCGLSRPRAGVAKQPLVKWCDLLNNTPLPAGDCFGWAITALAVTSN